MMMTKQACSMDRRLKKEQMSLLHIKSGKTYRRYLKKKRRQARDIIEREEIKT